MNVGKRIRLERIFNRKTGRTIVAPMDHGISMGPITGLINMREAVDCVARGGANAVVLHSGIVQDGHRGGGKDVGLIIHLSGSTSLSEDPNSKTLICSVEEAVKLGADAVSIHINLGNGHEQEMLAQFGQVRRDANNWGMPLLAMIYYRGGDKKDEYHPDKVAHSARVGFEMGADIVKVPYTGSPESFKKVVQGCGVPVVIAGGEKMSSDRELLEVVSGAIKAGSAGLSIGRNIFQHENPEAITSAMATIVHDNKTVDEALGLLKTTKAA